MGRGGGPTRSEASRCWWAFFSLAMAFSVDCGAGQITYTYDALGRLTVVQYGDGAQATYAFDAVGNRTRMTSGHPPSISAFTAAAVSASQINLNWSATDPQGPGIAGYTLSRNNSSIASLPSGTTSYSDTGLSAGTTYTYVLTVQDSIGMSATATQPGTTYNRPLISSFSATAAAVNSLTLNWTASDSGGPGGLTYSVARGSTTLGCTASPCTDTGLAAGTQYTYTLTASDSVGDKSSVSASQYTVPSAPGSITASSVTATTATISWTAASGTVSYYEYSTNGGSTWNSAGTALSASLIGLPGGSTISVQVKAGNAGGVGPSSSTSFTTYYSDTPSIVIGSISPGYSTGFNTPNAYGSMTPTTTSNGYKYYGFYDAIPILTGTYKGTYFMVSGFSADPGQAWLFSASVAGSTRVGASAIYSYSGGIASWEWTTGTIFPASGTYTATIVHK